mmetsp:Transcript_15604/g.22228  ORF Transcript_15604/g.22228 Transcript_15604/m.22228 type:complete len:454 (+) Transcript_15604:230-1591(+)
MKKIKTPLVLLILALFIIPASCEPQADDSSSPSPVPIEADINNGDHRHRFLFVAGKLFPALSKLFISREKANSVVASLKHSFHLGDFLPLFIAGFALVPFTSFVYNTIPTAFLPAGMKEQIQDGEATGELTPRLVKREFDETLVSTIVKHLSELALIGIVAYAIDMMIVAGHEMGFSFPDSISQSIAISIYVLWMAVKFKAIKKHVIYQSWGKGPSADPGKAALVDHFLNFLVYSIAIVILLDMLALNMGVALSSFFAIGSAGTIIFGWATRDVATDFVSGLALTIADKFHPGEEIILADGTGGYIEKIGWMHTGFRCYNELKMGLPNTRLLKETIRNLSRCKSCQVVQTIRLKYSDIPKIESILASIKEEVKQACPSIITVGRPFRATLRDFQDDHITVVCDFHFNLPPSGDLYWDNRQKVLQAIDLAMRKHSKEFHQASSYTSGQINKRSY